MLNIMIDCISDYRQIPNYILQIHITMFCVKDYTGVLFSSDQMGKEHNAGRTSRLSALVVVVRQSQSIPHASNVICMQFIFIC